MRPSYNGPHSRGAVCGMLGTLLGRFQAWVLGLPMHPVILLAAELRGGLHYEDPVKGACLSDTH